MSGFRFKLLFQVADNVEIGEGCGLADLCNDSNTAIVRLLRSNQRHKSSEQQNTSNEVVSLHNYSLHGEPYPTKHEAVAAGERAKFALLAWAVRNKIGIAFHGGMSSTQTVEPVGESSLFVFLHLLPSLRTSIDEFVHDFAPYFYVVDVPRKLVLASELYASSFMDNSPLSCLVTRVTAIEALIVRNESSSELKTMLRELRRIVKCSALSAQDKEQLLNAIGRQKEESIKRAGSRLTYEILGNRQFGQVSAVDVFKSLYDIRSKIVHDGSHGLSSRAFEDHSTTCNEFVSSLISAAIERFCHGALGAEVKI